MRNIHAWIIAAFALTQIGAGYDRSRKCHHLPIVFGNASWYGWFHEGRLTSGGRRFHAMVDSAASVMMPLHTWVRITNLSNGKSVVVRITDRGPYVPGRIIDVSLSMAIKLDMVRAGVVRVRVDPLSARPTESE